MLSSLRRAAIGYGKISEKRPIAAATFSTGVIFGLGDVLVQLHSGQVEKERTGRMAVYGTGVFGPFLGVWYAHVLPRLVKSGCALLRAIAVGILLLSIRQKN